MNIIKQTGGNVILVDAAGNILKSFVNVNALDIVSNNEIIIKYGYNQWSGIFADKIQNTQVEPAAAIPFAGDAYALVSLLSSDFFYQNTSVIMSLPIEIQAAASDETTALTAGTAKVTFRLPVAFTLTAVRASLTTAQTSGSIFTVDINQNGLSILGTKLTIDNTEKTSVTATTPATITTSALTDDAEITIDIDQIGDGTAKGLKLTLIGTR
jgi:hypothetical protein